MLPVWANGETFVSATMCPRQSVLVCQGLKLKATGLSREKGKQRRTKEKNRRASVGGGSSLESFRHLTFRCLTLNFNYGLKIMFFSYTRHLIGLFSLSYLNAQVAAWPHSNSCFMSEGLVSIYTQESIN